MKKIAWALLVVLGVAVYFVCPQDAASKARFYPQETITTSNSWTVKYSVKQIDDGQDDINFCAGGEELATVTIPWTLKSDGSPFTVDLTGKTVVSARVQFKGVGKTAETVEHKSSAPATRTFAKSGGVSTLAYLTIPAVPDGYIFDRITASTSVTGELSGSWVLGVTWPGYYTSQEDGTGVSGSHSSHSTIAGLLGGDVECYGAHSSAHYLSFSVVTRGKKVTLITTKSENPSCGSASYSGSLADGETTGWISLSLTSNSVNRLPVSVGGSGLVYIEIEYTTKDVQSAPATPGYSALTPTSVILTSTPGAVIVCAGQTKVSGSTWTGLSEQTTYTAYAYLPETSTHERSPNSPSTTFTTPSSAGPPSVQTLAPIDIGYTSATIRGNISSANGATPTRHFRWGYFSGDMGFVIDMGSGVGAYSIKLSGLEPGQTYYYRAYGINTYGTGNGSIQSFTTPYPTLPAPKKVSPTAEERIQDRRPWLTFTLTALEANPAEKYHARARIGESSSMVAPVFASESVNGGWQYWDGQFWQELPAGGVDPGTTVRVRPPIELGYKTYYWDCASYDSQEWGESATSTSFRILVVVVGNYYLDIESVEWLLYDLTVREASNGEIGQITFTVDNEDGKANEQIKYGDTVTLGVNDNLGNTDEFRGIVRGKSPQAEDLIVTAILGDGILAERRCKVDYAAQDIGKTVKAILDTYCQPLTSVHVNQATGFVAPVAAKDKTPLRVLEEIRRRYGVFYFVDKDWDLHFMKLESIGEAIVQIQYGDNGIKLMGAM